MPVKRGREKGTGERCQTVVPGYERSTWHGPVRSLPASVAHWKHPTVHEQHPQSPAAGCEQPWKHGHSTAMVWVRGAPARAVIQLFLPKANDLSSTCSWTLHLFTGMTVLLRQPLAPKIWWQDLCRISQEAKRDDEMLFSFTTELCSY